MITLPSVPARRKRAQVRLVPASGELSSPCRLRCGRSWRLRNPVSVQRACWCGVGPVEVAIKRSTDHWKARAPLLPRRSPLAQSDTECLGRWWHRCGIVVRETPFTRKLKARDGSHALAGPPPFHRRSPYSVHCQFVGGPSIRSFSRDLERGSNSRLEHC